MIKFADMTKAEMIFTHILKDGTAVHVAAERLRKRCLADKTLEIFNVPVDPRHVAQWMHEHNAINMERVKQMVLGATRPDGLAAIREPVIFGKDGFFTDGKPDVFFIDGHHRYTVHALCRLPVISSYVLEERYWREFQIDGAPPINQEILHRVPPGRLR